MPLPTLNLAPITKIDAVNMMLLAIGQAPVNSLDVPGIRDVAFAAMTLHNSSREVQTRGWWFNRESEYPLTPTSDGAILLPSNVLEVSPAASLNGRALIDRGNAIYDLDNHTGLFLVGKALHFDVVFFFDFEMIPQSARTAIAMHAARKFQSNVVGSEILYKFTKEDEIEAFAVLTQAELRSRKVNFLSNRRGCR